MLKTNTKEKFIAIGLVGMIFMTIMVLMSFNSQRVEAASSLFGGTCATASATSTFSSMTAGTATTTLPCFLGKDGVSSAILRMSVKATSTATTFSWRYEYSRNGIDWYADDYVPYIENATSTGSHDLTTPNSYTWVYASTSPNCNSTAVNSTNITGCKAVFIPTPDTWVRVIFSLPAGSANGMIYAELTPKT